MGYVQQVDLQEERSSTPCHLVWGTSYGIAQFAAHWEPEPLCERKQSKPWVSQGAQVKSYTSDKDKVYS